MFSKKATKFEEIFTVDLMLCSKCQIDGEDFVSFCGLLKKHELYDSFPDFSFIRHLELSLLNLLLELNFLKNVLFTF